MLSWLEQDVRIADPDADPASPGRSPHALEQVRLGLPVPLHGHHLEGGLDPSRARLPGEGGGEVAVDAPADTVPRGPDADPFGDLEPSVVLDVDGHVVGHDLLGSRGGLLGAAAGGETGEEGCKESQEGDRRSHRAAEGRGPHHRLPLPSRLIPTVTAKPAPIRSTASPDWPGVGVK